MFMNKFNKVPKTLVQMFPSIESLNMMYVNLLGMVYIQRSLDRFIP